MASDTGHTHRCRALSPAADSAQPGGAGRAAVRSPSATAAPSHARGDEAACEAGPEDGGGEAEGGDDSEEPEEAGSRCTAPSDAAGAAGVSLSASTSLRA